MDSEKEKNREEQRKIKKVHLTSLKPNKETQCISRKLLCNNVMNKPPGHINCQGNYQNT